MKSRRQFLVKAAAMLTGFGVGYAELTRSTRANALQRHNLSTQTRKPMIKLIYDGDIGPDPCDFSTLSVLHEYHNRGMIDLVGVIGETPDPYLASTFSIYNQVYGNDIPIGAYRDDVANPRISESIKQEYRQALSRFCHADPNKTIYEKYGNSDTKTQSDVLDSVETYRMLLAEEMDDSITIYAAGQLYNFESLVLSPPDQYSPLDGTELLKRKVKEFVFMGGYFPNSSDSPWYADSSGAEWNWWAFRSKNTTRKALKTLASMGKPITYVGAEQGPRVLVGREVVERLGRNHPTTESYYLFNVISEVTKDSSEFQLVKENPAFDELALFHVVEDGVGEYFDRIPGRVEVDENGANRWLPGSSNESYLVIRDGVEEDLREIITSRITGGF